MKFEAVEMGAKICMCSEMW